MRKIIISIILVMVLVVQIASVFRPIVYAIEISTNGDEIFEDTPFSIYITTEGEMLTLGIPSGLTLLSGGNGFDENGRIIIDDDTVELSFSATAGDYVLQLANSEGPIADSLSISVLAKKEAEPKIEEKPESDYVEEKVEVTAGISGMIWLDTNSDGIYDIDEKPIKGYPVYLYLVTDLSTVLDVAVTDEEGIYTFKDLYSGEYILEIKPNELGVDRYLLPIAGITGDNYFKNSSDWSTAITDTIVFEDTNAVSELNAGLRNPMGIVAIEAEDYERYLVYKDTDLMTVLSSWHWLAEAVNACGTDGAYTIVATEDDSDLAMSVNYPAKPLATTYVNKAVSTPNNKTITLTSDSDGPYTITQMSNARHIIVGGRLTLTNIILEGRGEVYGSNTMVVYRRTVVHF